MSMNEKIKLYLVFDNLVIKGGKVYKKKEARSPAIERKMKPKPTKKKFLIAQHLGYTP